MREIEKILGEIGIYSFEDRCYYLEVEDYIAKVEVRPDGIVVLVGDPGNEVYVDPISICHGPCPDLDDDAIRSVVERARREAEEWLKGKDELIKIPIFNCDGDEPYTYDLVYVTRRRAIVVEKCPLGVPHEHCYKGYSYFIRLGEVDERTLKCLKQIIHYIVRELAHADLHTEASPIIGP